jgi:hypothetical protein
MQLQVVFGSKNMLEVGFDGSVPATVEREGVCRDSLFYIKALSYQVTELIYFYKVRTYFIIYSQKENTQCSFSIFKCLVRQGLWLSITCVTDK